MTDFRYSRRRILKVGALAMTMQMIPGAQGSNEAREGATRSWSVGLQLYTLNREMAKDAVGTLKQVAALGISEVECLPVPGKSAVELRHMLDDVGLKAVSFHGVPGMLHSSPGRLIEDARVLGASYFVCPLPWVSDPARLRAAFAAAKGGGQESAVSILFKGFGAEDWKWNIDVMNRLGEQCQAAGLMAAYHNHGVEFMPLGQGTAYDEILRLTDPALVAMELDCAWVVNAGHDPVAYLERHPGRFPMLHVKDLKTPAMTTDLSMASTEVGQGVIDWPRLMAAARRSGVRHYLIEQEPPFARPPIESVQMSLTYLKALKI